MLHRLALTLLLELLRQTSKLHCASVKHGTGDMAQRLRALAALAEDLGLVPSAHMVADKQMSVTSEL